jgi:beta-aspartyl-peptidase (threonine type)
MMATIVVHGGAGGGGEPQLEGVRLAIERGREVLAASGSAVDAVVAAVATLEADGRFDAGRGSVRTADGGIELDAAVMEGPTRRAGAVAAITNVKQPVLVARRLLDEGKALMLAGTGADAYAAANNFELAPPDWFVTRVNSPSPGTVGAVARDDAGRLAAATSTGGMTGQATGRVGDSPLIGAGTYADERCAVSATGRGESFIRAVFAHAVAAAVAAGTPLASACAHALADVSSLEGRGGCIAITADGEVVLDHTTDVMPAGWATTTGGLYVSLTHV